MSDVRDENSDSLSTFDEKLASVNMVGQWKFDDLLEQLIGGPFPAGVPFVWTWKTINGMLDRSCEALPESDTVRRTLAFSNPGLPSGSTHTLLGSVQMVLPGELAWAHAHSVTALRFAIEGDKKLYTVVNGEPLPMEKHDLILTPGWTWHDHHNESEHRGIWLDVLDLPLVAAMKQLSYRVLGEKAQDVTKPSEVSAGLADQLRYPWVDVEKKLAALGNEKGDQYNGHLLEYTKPNVGGPVLPTLSCNIQMFQSGFATKEQRLTSSCLCYVIEGSGATIIDGKRIEWSERDIFVIPNWVWHLHINRSDNKRAVLFVVNDSPLLKTMGIDRREYRQ